MTNLETVQSIYQAFGRGDIPAILERLAPGVVWDHDLPGYGVGYLEPGTGREDVAKFFAGLDVLDFESFDILNFLEGGNQVAVTIRAALRNKTTGRQLTDLEVHIWTFGDDGLVDRFVHVVDRYAHVCAWRDVDL